ncbi:class I SAM-dependent methyltransferase [Paenibacillus oenotherae]|uniref:Class I SAM-dependent methyltransferase n=1 Tax=Paenibacillus oenotherae TaxID=1435645 RepID=A0ABS7D3Z1_9BACL|nr:class I SAM-dependent methyltransferase [Paenibacillus oenotherae]MBW7474640.1 class I SAM-dependent methyltransferase [Paenibacillus oenotherae]
MVQQWQAETYDEAMSYVSRMGAGLITLMEVKPGERIMDWGCGTGDLAKEIADLGADVAGIDGSPEMIAQAVAKYPGLAFIVADGQTYRGEAQYDGVFSNAALHWMTDAEGAAAGMASCLRPGGRLVAEFGSSRNVILVREAIEASFQAAGVSELLSWPWYFPTVGEYSAVLERAGFNIQAALCVARPTPLAMGERGLRVWLDTFANGIMKPLQVEMRDNIMREVESRLRRTGLYQCGTWVLDYERLRTIAYKR